MLVLKIVYIIVYIRDNISKGEKIKLVIEEKPHLECGVMVLKGKNQELLEKINKGLKELEKNGTYGKIMDKYLVGYNESLQRELIFII